jgi:hypothetical protein
VRGHQILLIVGCVKSLFTIAVEAVAYSVTRPLHFYRGYRTLLVDAVQVVKDDGL